ncbi:hypothetical protein AAVH_38528, partial [Aphelenchoides avenae]
VAIACGRYSYSSLERQQSSQSARNGVSCQPTTSISHSILFYGSQQSSGVGLDAHDLRLSDSLHSAQLHSGCGPVRHHRKVHADAAGPSRRKRSPKRIRTVLDR